MRITQPRTEVETRAESEAEIRRTLTVWKGLIAAGSLAVALLAAPAAASAAPLPAEGSGDCSVDSAELRWGVKESFRSYISGSIANGEWTVSDDMRYETPEFIWDQSRGEVEGSLDSGAISFTGAVHFTGHDGALQFDLRDPVIEFEGVDTAYLALTVGATDQGAAAAVQAASVRVAKMDLEGSLSTAGSELEIAGAVPRLTSEGAAAFNGDYGSYVAGDELDPATLTATVSGCELGESAAATAETEEPTAEPAAPAQEGSAQIPWLPIVVGAVALVVIGITVGMLIGGRKRPAPHAPQAEDGETPAE